MKKLIIVIAVVLTASMAFAHTALMACFAEGEGKVTCEGGFSDGSSAAGSKFRVEQNGKTVFEGKFDQNSEITFAKPAGEYQAVLDAGDGHKVIVKSKDIN